MELLQGSPLQRRIAGGPLEPALVLELATQIVDGLEAAHSKGIVHRDLKPSNLFVTERDRVKILDFGLVKLLEAHAGAAVSPDATTATSRDLETAAGLVMGTPPYMSPEQVRGEEVDARTDIFSFGAVLYEMATGQPAFAGQTPGLIYDAVLNRSPSLRATCARTSPPSWTASSRRRSRRTSACAIRARRRSRPT